MYTEVTNTPSGIWDLLYWPYKHYITLILETMLWTKPDILGHQTIILAAWLLVRVYPRWAGLSNGCHTRGYVVRAIIATDEGFQELFAWLQVTLEVLLGIFTWSHLWYHWISSNVRTLRILVSLWNRNELHRSSSTIANPNGTVTFGELQIMVKVNLNKLIPL